RERCTLKGASLLNVWLPDAYRATRDVDVLASGASDDAGIRSLVEKICAVSCPEDALRFDHSELRLEAIRAEEEYTGKRARFRAYLGNARISVQMDFAFGDALAAEPEEIEYPTMLKGLPVPRLRAYPREASVAEKLEAMVKLDIRNSRMKDFHDLWAISGAFAFDGPTLQRAIAACFERRATLWLAVAPRALTPAFYQTPEIETRWRRYLAAGAVLAPPPAQFEVIGERIIHFIGPVRSSIVEGATFTSTWGPGGPWLPKGAGAEAAP
ncbi:MAG TPA: nucleotidyl transferase AbiEii/AbiGii toxin family protein, partial [Candidatus Krumholzibacteria bacterium]